MRITLLTAALLAAVLVTSDTRGQDCWSRFELDFHRMNCWPEPFVHADRELVRLPLIAMTNSGWKLEHTLSHHFFDSDTQELTRAGQLKLHWIMTQAPPHRRSVWVVRTQRSDWTDTRLASVRENIQQLLPNSERPEVLVSDTIPPGGSGEYFDHVDRQLKASVPVPRLPPREGFTEAGG
jgi:hypothetical protein